jgi:hypothetical protein
MEIDAIRKAIYDEARMFHPEEEVSTEGIKRDRPCELSK